MDYDTTTAQHYIQRAGELIASHRLTEATGKLEESLSSQFENPDVVTALKYTSFWNDRQQRVDGPLEPFERGEYLLGQWQLFQGFVGRIGSPVETILNALRQHVFGTALDAYRVVYQDRANRDARLHVRIGRCYKGAGQFDQSMRFLREAAAQRPDDAEVLAELADVCALVDEVPQAKAFFREAFFIDPQRVDVTRLESELIPRVARVVAEAGYTGKALVEWIPVYAVLHDVFNVKRELRSIEYGRLRQSIYELERDMREGTGDAEIVKPRLINRYFWLIDHYVAVKEAPGRIEEVKLKIRSVDSDVYDKYDS